MIACIDGWWWPESDVRARPVITGDCDAAIAELLPHIGGRSCIVQAGGNVGVYPIALAKHFDRVVTVEPDPENRLNSPGPPVAKHTPSLSENME